MNMIVAHQLFPTLVCQFEYSQTNAKKFKSIFKREVHKHLTDDGFSSEVTGHVSIHHEPAFVDVYKFITKCVKQFIETYHVDPKQFDINVVKSWLNLTQGQANARHAHRDAQISFVYYVNIPVDIDSAIQFYDKGTKHQPFAGFCSLYNADGCWDQFNSSSWRFDPQAGTVFVFPSSLYHDTVDDAGFDRQGVDVKTLWQNRISIVGDVVLTFTHSQPKYLGLQPVENWRTFDVKGG